MLGLSAGFPGSYGHTGYSLEGDRARDGEGWAAWVLPQVGVVQVPTISVRRVFRQLVTRRASCSHTHAMGLDTWLKQFPGNADPVSAHTSTLLGTPEPATPDEAPLSVARWEPLLLYQFLSVRFQAFGHHGFCLGQFWGGEPILSIEPSYHPSCGGRKADVSAVVGGGGTEASPAEAPGELCPWGSMVAGWLLVYQDLAGRTRGAFCPDVSQCLIPLRIEASLFWV